MVHEELTYGTYTYTLTHKSDIYGDAPDISESYGNGKTGEKKEYYETVILPALEDFLQIADKYRNS
jgi:hypothetical protein